MSVERELRLAIENGATSWLPTPLMLHVLLGVLSGGFPTHYSQQSLDEAVQLLARHDLLKPREPGEEFQVSDRGQAFIDMLTKTPLPERRWIDPRWMPL